MITERHTDRIADVALIEPHGGSLVDLRVGPERAEELIRGTYPSLVLDGRGLCDLELLGNGAFSPLTGFLRRADYESVVGEMRLADGTPWPVPICLASPSIEGLREGGTVGLRDVQGRLLAVLHLEDMYRYDRRAEMNAVFGTEDPAHPGVAYLAAQGPYLLGGRVEVIGARASEPFARLRLDPAQVRARFAERGWSHVVAFHTRSVMDRAHETLLSRARSEPTSGVLFHPLVPIGGLDEVDLVARVQSCRVVAERYCRSCEVLLALLPLATREAGPREAVWRAIVARNFGCRDVIVAPDHRDPRLSATAPVAADDATAPLTAERNGPTLAYRNASDLTREIRTRLESGSPLPEGIFRPEVVQILRRAYPPKHERGFCVWSTGLSGSGKSTLTQALLGRLPEFGRTVTVLDGDEIRTHLSKGLGFSKEDRDTNIRRVGYVAGQVVKHGGVALCACISPYRGVRNEARAMCRGQFIEVFCNTPIEVCEARDVKGLYAKARRGEVKGVTGIDDPYEPPLDTELEFDGSRQSVNEIVERIIAYLVKERYLLAEWDSALAASA